MGTDLAERADAVAVKLDGGDETGARQDALELQKAVEQAIEAGDVPPALRRPLRAAVAELVASIRVPPPAPPPTEEPEDDDREDDDEGEKRDDDDRGEGKGKGKGKKGPGR